MRRPEPVVTTTLRDEARQPADAVVRRERADASRWNSQVWWKSSCGSMLGRSRKHKRGTADDVLKRDSILEIRSY